MIWAYIAGKKTALDATSAGELMEERLDGASLSSIRVPGALAPWRAATRPPFDERRSTHADVVLASELVDS